MEKRISNGPNSLSLNEVTSLNKELNNIINEMKEYNNDPNGSMEKIKKSYNNENDDEIGNVVNVMVKKEGKYIYILRYLLMELNHELNHHISCL